MEKNISKSVSLDNLDDFVKGIKSLLERPSVSSIRLAGLILKKEGADTTHQLSLNWTEKEEV